MNRHLASRVSSRARIPTLSSGPDLGTVQRATWLIIRTMAMDPQATYLLPRLAALGLPQDPGFGGGFRSGCPCPLKAFVGAVAAWVMAVAAGAKAASACASVSAGEAMAIAAGATVVAAGATVITGRVPVSSIHSVSARWGKS